MPIEERMSQALTRISNGHGAMSIPPDATDPDMVIVALRDERVRLLRELETATALVELSAAQAKEALDARDALAIQNAALTAEVAQVVAAAERQRAADVAERDEARAEVERLKAERDKRSAPHESWLAVKKKFPELRARLMLRTPSGKEFWLHCEVVREVGCSDDDGIYRGRRPNPALLVRVGAGETAFDLEVQIGDLQ